MLSLTNDLFLIALEKEVSTKVTIHIQCNSVTGEVKNDNTV